ncbi:MAG TPA: outer membrane beta-barrel protein [Rhizomicrobium sp.]|nr:outer membrane beta-barrel protein [Rhizomicrobium sp.]
MLTGALALGGLSSAAAKDWTGVYAGASVGFATDTFAFPYGVNLPGQFLSGESAITSRGPLAGIVAGYNHEFGDGIVAGVELDGSWSDVSGASTVHGGAATVRFATRQLNFATARLRGGYALGRFLPYFTAGLTLATAQTSYALTAPPSSVTAGGGTATRSGFFPHVGVVGLGLEYALTSNFSVKGEYLYDFVNARYAMYEPAPPTAVGFGTREMYHVARVGLNWKLDQIPMGGSEMDGLR